MIDQERPIEKWLQIEVKCDLGHWHPYTLPNPPEKREAMYKMAQSIMIRWKSTRVIEVEPPNDMR